MMNTIPTWCIPSTCNGRETQENNDWWHFRVVGLKWNRRIYQTSESAKGVDPLITQLFKAIQQHKGLATMQTYTSTVEPSDPWNLKRLIVPIPYGRRITWTNSMEELK
jgi:hypothetical protein